MTAPMAGFLGKTQSAWREWSEEYTLALLRYIVDRRGAALRTAQDLGRLAAECNWNVSDLVVEHHKATEAALLRIVFSAGLLASAGGAPGLGTGTATQVSAALEAAGRFFAEAVAPLDAARADLQDASRALRHQYQLLERQAEEVAHALLDNTGQTLTYLRLVLPEVSRELPDHSSLDQVQQLLLKIEEQLRRLSGALRPAELDYLGLTPAIEHLARKISAASAIAISVESSIGRQLPPALEEALYRIVEEALDNVQQHSQATQATVRLGGEGNLVTCSVRDNGTGLDLPSLLGDSAGGLGLIGIRDRIQLFGGTFSVQSAPGQGTELIVTAPY